MATETYLPYTFLKKGKNCIEDSDNGELNPKFFAWHGDSRKFLHADVLLYPRIRSTLCSIVRVSESKEEGLMQTASNKKVVRWEVGKNMGFVIMTTGFQGNFS